MFKNIYTGKKVLITGHTGFKGSWLTLWLQKLGADVCGFSIDIPSTPSLFELSSSLKKKMGFKSQDVCDLTTLKKNMKEFSPDIVFHLAAQSIVSKSVSDPIATFRTNVLGTVNVLEVIKNIQSIKSVVIVTSDKCYENLEWDYGYRENDKLGGKDPYSASKACAEIAFSSYFRTFFNDRADLFITSARAGNVIGGGDWALNRIVPDIMRAVEKNGPVEVRNLAATRPWQHVLEPLSGYLHLASWPFIYNKNLSVTGESFNFGPNNNRAITVGELIKEMQNTLGEIKVDNKEHALLGKEAGLLKLCCDKAESKLNWRGNLNFKETAYFTAGWFKKYFLQNQNKEVDSICLGDIEKYMQLARERKLSWAI